MSWQALEDGNKELAEYGAQRFASNHVGYLATIRKDGSPRVHPMTPFVGEGHLLFFTNDGSLFCQDLLRDGRYAMHCSVEDQEGGEGEFLSGVGLRSPVTMTCGPLPKSMSPMLIGRMITSCSSLALKALSVGCMVVCANDGSRIKEKIPFCDKSKYIAIYQGGLV
jgi:hypothetical protein